MVFPDPGGPEMYTVLLVKHKLVQRFSQFGEMLAQIYCLREVNVLLSSPPNFYCFSHVAAFGNSLVNFIERCRLECNLLPSKRERKNQYQQHEQHNAASTKALILCSPATAASNELKSETMKRTSERPRDDSTDSPAVGHCLACCSNPAREGLQTLPSVTFQP